MLTLTNCLPDVDLDPADCRLKLANHAPVVRCGSKILVIDDDPDLCLGLHIRLGANYYDTCFANDAESAFKTALAEMRDLIILDIGLPDYDEYFVLESLSMFPELADVPVIALTARNRFIHEKRCHDAGVKRFFEKPVDDRRLLTAIRQFLG